MDVNLIKNQEKEISVETEGNLPNNFNITRSDPDGDDNEGMDFIMNDRAREIIGNQNAIKNDEPNESDEEDYTNNQEDYADEEIYIEDIHDQPTPAGYINQPTMSYEDIEREKAIYLSKLNRLLSSPSCTGRKLGPSHSLSEIKSEVFRIEKDIEINTGIQYCKNGLMFCVNTIEMLSNNYVGNNLNGWSNFLLTDVNNNTYDSVFEELLEKYSVNMTGMPEVKLIFMIAGSAFMFNLQKSLADKAASSPNMLSSLMKSFTGGESSSSKSPPQTEMNGPSVDIDSLLKKMNDDSGDISDASSMLSEKVIQVKGKKRGRPKKN